MWQADDTCYSEETITECSVDDVVCTYQVVRKVIENFNGDRGELYLLFYDSVSGDEIALKNINRTCSVILGFEEANTLKRLILAKINFCEINFRMDLFLRIKTLPYFA